MEIEEEYFRKHYPDFCYNGKPLSPYWDLFQDGVEFGERQSEKKIEELKSELTKKADTNHTLVEQMAKLEEENAELKETLKTYNGCGDWDNDFHTCRVYLQHEELQEYIDQLTKAKEIIRTFLNMPMPNNEEVFADVGEFLTKAEQFIKEIEK